MERHNNLDASDSRCSDEGIHRRIKGMIHRGVIGE